MIAKAVLRGYVLEELLAFLLQDSGYTLLVHTDQDPDALCRGGNGLRVHGRGADHQADALGEVVLPTPFTLPVRLFCEAKHVKAPIGLEVVRNALGVVTDVNEHFGSLRSAAVTTGLPLKRYQYRYALFSASGFTSDAEEYALAQQISLVDLRAPSFAYLLTAAERLSRSVITWAERTGATPFPTQVLREAMRVALGTWSYGQPPDLDGGDQELVNLVAASISDVVKERQLWLAFPSAPFVLALQPDDPFAFRELIATARGPVECRLGFTSDNPEKGSWALTVPNDRGTEGGSRRLIVRFGLPAILDSWILADGEVDRVRARDVKRTFLRSLVVYDGGRPVELRFAPRQRRSRESLADPTLRREAFDPELTYRPVEEVRHEGRWSPGALERLLQLLREEGWPQAEMIEQAVSQGGRISRAQVMDVGGYDDDRTLRGITRPVSRLVRRLEDEGLLPHDALPAFVPDYERGVIAQGFTVPDEFRALTG